MAFLTIDEASEMLHLKKSYLYRLIHERKLPVYKPLNGRVLFDQEELEQFIRKGKVSTRDELNERAGDLINNRGGAK